MERATNYYSGFLRDAVKEEVKFRGFTTNGLKAELVDRLVNDDMAKGRTVAQMLRPQQACG